MTIEELEVKEVEASAAQEKDQMFYDLLMEIRSLLVDIKRNTGRQISPG